MKQPTASMLGALVAILVLFASAAQAQNPVLHSYENLTTCSFLESEGLIPTGSEFILVHSDGAGVFPFDQVIDFNLFGVPATMVASRSDAGNDFIVDWTTTGLKPVAMIVSPEAPNASELVNAYIYDPTLFSDTRVHTNGPNEADAGRVHFLKVCFLPQAPPPPPPGDGCTLTQGYWKTHSENGPAPYDATWNELPGADGTANSGDDGSSTPFFTTGRSWYQIFQTNLSGGNKYIGLAHQWMAATLNGLADAELSDVSVEITAGQALLAAHAANWNNPRGYSRAVRDQMNAIAGVLDDFNNGTIGPGHCPDNFGAGASRLVGEPQVFARTPAYPNPFNPQSQFTLSVVEEQHVTAELFNTIGQRVATLFTGTVEVGQAQQVTIDAGDMPSGMYLVRITGERFTDSFRVTLLK